MTPKRLLEAYDRIDLQASDDLPRVWFVVDTKSSEPEVNWPGDLISSHDDHQNARLAWAEAIIRTAETEER